MPIYPISKIQNQFRIINKMYPESSAYNMPSVFEINGSLNIEALKTSLNEIIKRHQILRTSFTDTAEGAVQEVHNNAGISLPVIDLQSTGEISPEKIDRLIREEIAALFDLQNGPLIRAKLFQIKKDKHYFSITMHHIITDLHSKKMFAGELSFFYNSLISGDTAVIEEQIHQYCEYAGMEKNLLNGPGSDTMLTYWKDRLKGAESFLNLPVDHPRSEFPSTKGNAHEIKISKMLTGKIREFSRNNSVNIFVTLLSAYYVLLYKYTSQSSIIIGLPLTNRLNDARKEIMGCLMNIVPLRIDDIGDCTFTDLISSVRKEMLGAHRNQEIPFEEIVNKVKPARITGINPLYQTGFAFEPPMELNFEGLECIPLTVHGGGSQLETFMTLWETGDAISGRLEYNTSLFENITILNLTENYISLISELIENSEKPAADISITSGSAVNMDIADRNEVPFSGRFRSVNHMIEEQAFRTPDNIAAVFNDTAITYRELNERANRLAHYLIESGIRNESIAGVYIERSIEMLVGLIAIHKAGGAYLPLDPEFPPSRISYMIEHSKLSVILTQRSLADDIPETGAKIISLDSESHTISQKSSETPMCPVKEDSLAYVIYTSGSTGKPKGVQVTHSSAINFLISMAKIPGIEESDILLAVTTISFDISVLELFLPLTCGAQTVILPKEETMDGRLLMESIIRYNPTIMQATPTTWRILYSSGWQGSKKMKVLCGGEVMPRDIAQKLVNSSSSLWNMYGPTETTVWSTCFQVVNPEKPIYIGSPIDNTYIYILDNNLQPVPRGLPGEIYIGGSGVARGYLNDSTLTSERFIKDPFSKTGCRIYRTGDTGRYTYDGSLEFFSRIDSQVKVRGYRIELPEIEFHLNQHNQITDSAAAVIKDSSGNGRIAGYFVTQDDRAIDTGELRRFLQERIPGYMIPDIFITVEKIPLTPNGKIDRKALPEPDFKHIAAERKVVLPANITEQKLHSIWQEVLSVDIIGIYDNYFDLGGNSFLAVEIVNRINREFYLSVTILMMFKYVTISSMAEYISSADSSINNDDKFIESIKNRSDKQRAAYTRQKALREENQN